MQGEIATSSVLSFLLFLGHISANTVWSTLRRESGRKLQNSQQAILLKDLQASSST